jgi:hypothetical protein
MMRDPVRSMLQARGCPPDVVDGGLIGLQRSWSAVVESIANGYELTLDDYLNDMDLRDLLAAAQDIASPDELETVREEIARADAEHFALTVPCSCLWGDDIAEEDGLDPEREWWYYRRPIEMGDQLRDDLSTWGLLE